MSKIQAPHISIVTEERCLNLRELELIAANKLLPAQRASLMKHVLHCKLCSDALEGIRHSNESSVFADKIKVLNRQLYDFRVVETEAVKPRRISMNQLVAVWIFVILGLAVLLLPFVLRKSMMPEFKISEPKKNVTQVAPPTAIIAPNNTTTPVANTKIDTVKVEATNIVASNVNKPVEKKTLTTPVAVANAAASTSTSTPAPNASSDEVYYEADEMPRFHNANYTTFSKWVVAQFKAKKLTVGEAENKLVKVEFNIDDRGHIGKIRMLEGVNYDINRELIQIIGESDGWKPGRKNNSAVKVRLKLEIDLSK
jgi:hypothetical protein